MSEKTSPAINLICDFKVGSSKGESYKKFINYISTEKNKENVKKQYLKIKLIYYYLFESSLTCHYKVDLHKSFF